VRRCRHVRRDAEGLEVTLAELETPCLLVDLNRVRTNLRRMADLTSRAGIQLRPHIKTHKSVRLMHEQLRLGAKGITCAKVSEANVMFAGGARDIFLANNVVGDSKVARVVSLARAATIRVGADSLHVARPIAHSAASAGVQVHVLLEVDLGMGRGGVPARDAVALASEVARLRGLSFAGIFGIRGYSGGPERDERHAAAVDEAHCIVAVANELRRSGLECREVSLGSTVLADFHSTSPGITEIRPGTYIFGDNACIARAATTEADVAATVAARVIARPKPGVAVLDAGTKSLSNQRWPGAPEGVGWARVKGHPQAVVIKTWEEHGVLILDQALERTKVGDVIELIPNHICPVVDLFDTAILTENGHPVASMKIDARGCSQ
jgi:D-serine deaminase-like pyridoxal phosphate-dependent protein